MIAPSPAEPLLDRVAALVGDETGMTFTGPGGLERLERGVRREAARQGLEAEAYLARLFAESDLLGALIDELSVGETYFFRHAEQFRFLAERILPERLAAREDAPVRVWSAGCSTGEEPYSVAMLFAERGLLDRVRILATDVSAAALDRARAARYGSWSLRGDGAVRGLPFLRREGADLVVAPELRAAVEFRRLNLAAAGRDGPRGQDVVLCRNVLIYLDRAAVCRAAARLLAALEPGGWLVAGPSEPLLGALAPFEVVTTAAGLYYRKPAGGALPSLPAPRVLPPPSPPRPRVAAAPPKRARPEARRKIPSTGPVERAPGDGDGPGAAPAGADAVATEVARAATLLEARRDEEAAAALRRLVYLEPTLAIGQFLLGEALGRLGDRAGAARAFGAAARIARSLPRETVLSHGEGERAGRLADAAAAAAARLGSGG